MFALMRSGEWSSLWISDFFFFFEKFPEMPKLLATSSSKFPGIVERC